MNGRDHALCRRAHLVQAGTSNFHPSKKRKNRNEGARTMKRFLLLSVIVITACGPWLHVGGRYESPSRTFRIDIPQGWRRLDTDKYLLITRDGPFSHYILIQENNIGKSYQHTKKRIRNGMLPHEMAEVIIDEISSDPLVTNFSVVENVPTKIENYDGFKIVFNYRTKEGLNHKTIYQGFVVADRFYSIRYNASAKNYFEQDIVVFEQLLDSFNLSAAQVM